MEGGENFMINNIKKGFTLTIVFVSLLVFWGIRNSFAAATIKPIELGKPIMAYNVIHNEFSVIWQVTLEEGDTVSGCDVIVYEADGETIVNAHTTSIFKSNGVMQVTVGGTSVSGFTDLVPSTGAALKEYKFRTKTIVNGEDFYYPSAGVALTDDYKVHTQYQPGEDGNPFAAPFCSQMYFDVYYKETSESARSPLPDAFILLEVNIVNHEGDYPVAGAGDQGYGWSENDDYGSTSVNPGNYIYGTDHKFMDLAVVGSGTITLYCIAGKYGQQKVVVNNFDPTTEEGTYCLTDFDPAANIECDIESSDEKYPAFEIIPNTAPQLTVTPEGIAVNRQSGIEYTMKTGEEFKLNFTATDPDAGESVVSWTLDNKPDTMPDIEFGSAIGKDPNEARIIWTIDKSNGFEQTVTVNAINNDAQTGSVQFTIIVTDGVPDPPDSVVITTAAPKTLDDLSCTITGGSDPLGDPITYNYKWYNDNSPQDEVLGDTNDTVITLSNTYTAKGETWNCQVTVSDDPPDNDGTSGPTTSTTGVEILNTSPEGTPVVSITSTAAPSAPTTVSDLSASVDISGCTDDDPVDSLSSPGKWWEKALGAGSFSETTISALTLSHNDTEKGEKWIYKATVTDGHDSGNTDTSNELEIQNTRPDPPANVTITKVGSGIECSVTPGANADADGDTLQYKYDWVCMIGGSEDHRVDHSWMDTNTDLLTETAADQTWYCEVTVKDTGFGAEESSTFTRSDSDIYISNTPPEWKSSVPDPLTISPDPAYNDQSLTCTVATDSVKDNDGHDVFYTYQWKKDDVSMVGASYRDANTSSLTSTLSVSGGLDQGATYKCEVTLWDGMDHDVGTPKTTSSVTIGNRMATIKVWRGNDEIGDGETLLVTETEALVLTIVSDDADNNTLNFLNSNIPTVAVNSGAVFDPTVGDPNYAEFTWTPAQGDAATYEVVFKVEETYYSSTGQETQIITQTVQIRVIYPSNVIDNFEFQSEPEPDWYLPTNDEQDMEVRNDHGWSVLTGSGDIYRKSYENDPNDHYLNMVSSESDPLKYITTLWLADPNETKDFYEMRCFIGSNGPYSVEAYVHVVDTEGGENDYFLRYIPEDPSQHDGNKFKVDEMRINYYIGNEFIDPNGRQLKRNMEDDIHNAIAAKGKQYQSHYDYVWGFILRGDIDKFDNLEVVYGERDIVSPKTPKTGSAVGINKAVVLTWEDDPNQDADVLGYEIAYEKDSQIYTPKFYVWEEGISGEVKSCTIPFADNLAVGEFYSFTIKAFDDERIPNYSSAIGPFDARPHIDEIAPDMTECHLTAQAPKDAGETINLAWTDPNEANLSYFIIYKNGIQITDPPLDKTILTYQVTGLVNDTPYEFKLEGFNGDNYGSSGTSPDTSPEVTGIPRAPELLVFDDFEYVAQSQTPMQHGWKVLQGSGNMDAVEEDGNSCMYMTTNYTTTAKTNFIVTKFVDNPEDYTNTKLHFNLKGLVNEFKIDLLVSDTNGNKYFLRYSPNATYSDDDHKPDNCYLGMYITHYLGWQNNNGAWHPVVRDLQKDLHDGVPGATFGSFLGMVIRGEVFIDNILFMRAMPEVGNLVAISDDTEEVDLFWTRTDPNVDDFYLSIDGAADVFIDDTTHFLSIDGNQVDCTITGLTNDITYSFTVKQGNSSGVTVSATPHDFGFTEDFATEGDWTDQGQLGTFSIQEDLGIHSKVLVIDPDDNAAVGLLVRYFVGLDDGIPTVGKSKVMVNIKSGQDFVLWFKVEDTTGVEYNLLYGPGQGNNSAFGTWSFSDLPPCDDGGNWTDGRWHTISLDLNDNLLLSGVQGYDVPVDEITYVSIGGCDDVSVDNLSVY